MPVMYWTMGAITWFNITFCVVLLSGHLMLKGKLEMKRLQTILRVNLKTARNLKQEKTLKW